MWIYFVIKWKDQLFTSLIYINMLRVTNVFCKFGLFKLQKFNLKICLRTSCYHSYCEIENAIFLSRLSLNYVKCNFCLQRRYAFGNWGRFTNLSNNTWAYHNTFFRFYALSASVTRHGASSEHYRTASYIVILKVKYQHGAEDIVSDRSKNVVIYI